LEKLSYLRRFARRSTRDRSARKISFGRFGDRSRQPEIVDALCYCPASTLRASLAASQNAAADQLPCDISHILEIIRRNLARHASGSPGRGANRRGEGQIFPHDVGANFGERLSSQSADASRRRNKSAGSLTDPLLDPILRVLRW
jgi:hypothetical protein